MISDVCAVWATATLVEAVPVEVFCRTVISLPGDVVKPRFAYVSVGSPIEKLTGDGSSILGRDGVALSVHDLANRLLDGEVAGVVAPQGPVEPTADTVALPERLVEKRQAVRRANVLARFLIRQIGLEEVSSHRGAPAVLYADVAALWSTDLSLCTDPAMLLTLGADRQRYVDSSYNDRATDRLPRALGRLQDLGVRSYPRLVII